MDVIVAVKEPNDKYFFDKYVHSSTKQIYFYIIFLYNLVFYFRSCEGIKGNNKLPHLTLLGYIVRKRPIWLYRISSHPLLKELLRLLKVIFYFLNTFNFMILKIRHEFTSICYFIRLQTETDIVTVVSALLIINILLPIIPGLLGPHLQDIFVAFR